MNLMIYDLVCFLLCFSAMAYVVATRPDLQYDDWPVKHALFACQIVYGYLSMPFFFFTLPVLSTVLTHAMPTGYDPQGRCRALDKSASLKRRQLKCASEGTCEVEQQLVDSGEANDLLNRVKNMFINGVPSASANSGLIPGRPATET